MYNIRRRFSKSGDGPNYLTITAEAANCVIYLGISSSLGNKPTLQFSKNGGAWTNWQWSDWGENTHITLDNIGDNVRIRGNNRFFSNLDYPTRFYISTLASVSGDVTSLLNNRGGMVSSLSASAFKELFSYSLISTAPNIPTECITSNSCDSMFKGCSRLQATPSFATVTRVEHDGCKSMFENCTSLTTISKLPATLGDTSYYRMFAGCTSLVNAPELPSMTLAQGCYREMFKDCTSLTTAPVLPATSLTNNCYAHMFYGCTSLTEAPMLPATTLAYYCYGHMFEGCTSLVTAPILHATAVAEQCYTGMFMDCTSLTQAPELPAISLARYCYQGMFYGCSSLTTAPNLPATTLVSGCYKNMFRNCTNLNLIKCLATNVSASECTYFWVENVAATGTFIKDANMLNWTIGASGIPEDWTVETATE